MARQTVNTGSSANDNTGDTMRDAGTKINANFSELYTILGGDTTNSSILFGNNSIIAEGVANDFETTLTFTNPTADRTITFPDTTGTVLLSGSTLTLTAPVLTGSSSSAGSILFKEDTDNGTNAVTLIGPAATADVTLTLPAVTDTLVGKTTSDTLTNKTLTSPVLTTPKIADAGFIADANGNEQIVFQTTSSAVNHVELTNAATDNAPQLNAVGTNSNISLSIAAKGTGALLFNSKVRYKEETLTGTTVTASAVIPLTIHNATSSVACTLANGASGGDKGFIKKFININTGVVTITPATYGGSSLSTIVLAQHETASLIWSGASWYSIGGDSPKFLGLTAGTTAVSKVVTTDANGDYKMPDGDKIRLGTGTDMTMFHDGTNSFLTNATGIMKVATETSGIAVTIGHTTSETTIGDNLTVAGTSAVVGAQTYGAVTTEHGAGAIATSFAPITRRYTENGVIITKIHFDLTGLKAKGAAGDDVIGLAAGGAAYIGRNVVSANGVIYRAELACIEVPAAASGTLTTDVDIATNASASLVHDGAGGSAKLIDSAAMVAGEQVVNIIPALTANHYFYLVEADTTASDCVYSAGQFILTLYGHAIS
jgi:hypothetical protein